jgi:RNA polymerase sigma-70 factor, ECF subfamily
MEYSETRPLISACIAGNEYAIEQFVCQYQTGVFRLALSVLQDTHEANDAAQDTFIAALKALNTYQDYSSVKAWLYTIALNISRSRLRKRKTAENIQKAMTALFRLEIQKQDDPEETLIKNQKDRALWDALQALGEKHRLPVVLYYYHELPVSEIAEILQTNEGTIHSRLFTARARLRFEVEKQLQIAGE